MANTSRLSGAATADRELAAGLDLGCHQPAVVSQKRPRRVLP
jgi:hypothetical protein